MIDFISHRNIFLIVAAVLVAAGISAVAVWGLKPGVDFTGGSLLEIEFTGEPISPAEAREALTALDLGAVTAARANDRGMILRFREAGEEEHRQALAALEKAARAPVTELRFDSIGPVIGRELRDRSLWALAAALVAIMAYVAWAFRHVSKPVSSWKYGVVALLALVHDIAIPAGVFAALGRFRGVEVDVLFITALLTVMGFSVHDTIVVFDRIREKLRAEKGTVQFAPVVNRSMNETIARSVNTSLTTLIVLLAIFIFGGATLKYFTLALIIGIIAGTWSSIFVASPLLVFWNNLGKKGIRE